MNEHTSMTTPDLITRATELSRNPSISPSVQNLLAEMAERLAMALRQKDAK